MMPRVALVVPPFVSVSRPHLGTSLLKAGLLRRDISAVVRYSNLLFCEDVGTDLPEWIGSSSPVNQLLGEWVFAPFIGTDTDEETLAKHLSEVQPKLLSGHPATTENMNTLRAGAAKFVETEAQALAGRYTIVGFSTSFQQTCASLAIARRLRQLDSSVHICLGGANCEGVMGMQLLESFSYIDFVFSGECDAAFPEFASRILVGAALDASFAYSCKIVEKPTLRGMITAIPIRQLDALPVPDMDDYFEALRTSSFGATIKSALPFETSRGCWWGAKHQCTFCGLNAQGMAYRSKSASRALSEITELVERYQVVDVQAVDNILDNKHIESFFAALGHHHPRLSMFYEVKSNLRFDQLQVLARAGVRYVQPGIESLDDHVLRLMDKGVIAAQNISFIRCCDELGIQLSWNILFGFPGEGDAPYERMMELIPKIEHLSAPNSWCPIRIDRFSPYFERSEELGFTNLHPYPAYEIVFGLPSQVVSNLAYYFAGDGRNTAAIETQERFIRLIEQWQTRCRSADRAMLTWITEGGEYVVVDSRGCASESLQRLAELDVRIIRLCRRPATKARILDLDDDKHAVALALEGLIAKNYVLQANDYLVSVVVEPDLAVHDVVAEGCRLVGDSATLE